MPLSCRYVENRAASSALIFTVSVASPKIDGLLN